MRRLVIDFSEAPLQTPSLIFFVLISWCNMTHGRDPVQVMVWISNTDDYPNWNDEKKLARLEKVLEWHSYIENLHREKKVTHVWGSHQLLARAEFTVSQGVLVAVYEVESWSEFNYLLSQDPLREVSQYNTSPLCSILEDREEDLSRYERHKSVFLGENPGKERLAIYESERARYNLPPEYVGKYDYKNPRNSRTDFEFDPPSDQKLNFLILGVNPPEYITMWDDLRKLIHHEKVTWWHDYVAMLINQDKISHGWSTNDFCLIAGPATRSCGPILIYSVDSFEEFNFLYKLDPLRDATMFWSVLLQPIADQRALDEQRFNLALQRQVVPSAELPDLPSVRFSGRN